ncbi:MAG TPA: hypothetical protein VFS21_32880 [Roseiflexaceae bacterium]|nr:hypothetical protein [Roseiflexaceae bacterium]
MGETLRCPSCGAPAPARPAGELWVCVYCDSVVRLSAGEAGPEAAVERTLPADQMPAIRQLLLAGRRSEAADAYRQASGADEQETAQAIESLAREISLATVRGQQLSRYGWAALGLSALGIALVAWAGWTGALSPLAALALAVFPVSLVLLFLPNLRVSLRYLTAPRAPATVERTAYIGLVRVRTGPIHTYRILLRVQPPDAPAFPAELVLPVRDQNRHKLAAGATFDVRYRSGEPDSVIFD